MPSPLYELARALNTMDQEKIKEAYHNLPTAEKVSARAALLTQGYDVEPKPFVHASSETVH